MLRMTEAGIPVMGHLGLTPQSVNQIGGYRVQGRSDEQRDRILKDAKDLEAAGVFSLVLEAVPSDLAAEVTQILSVPTIGIGAGPGTDGQVLVYHDFLGITQGKAPKFVKRYADLGAEIRKAAATFAKEVAEGTYPRPGTLLRVTARTPTALSSIRVVADKIRCPNCGALNAADAQWCNQCLESFVAPEPEPEPTPLPEPPAVASPDAGAVAADGADGTSSEAVATGAPAEGPGLPVGTQTGPHGAFTVTEQGILWTCKVCEAVNPLDAPVCRVCGATFADTVREEPERIEHDPNMAAMLSLFMPGAGHAYLGLWGQAVARGIVSIWTILVVAVSVLSKDQPGSGSITIVFGAVAVLLWILAAHDSYREAKHEPKQVVLKGRMFLYLVLGMLTLLMALLMTTSLSQT